MEHCIGSITAWLIKQGAIDSDDKELYEYAISSLLLSLSPLIFMAVIGVLAGCVKESILLILPFIMVRKFSGGFHAKHVYTCLISSCGLLLLCLYTALHIACGIGLHIALLVSIFILIICSPIDSENRKLEKTEIRAYKRTTGIITLAFSIVYIILIYLHAESYAVCIAVGLILSAGLQVPCIPQLIRAK